MSRIDISVHASDGCAPRVAAFHSFATLSICTTNGEVSVFFDDLDTLRDFLTDATVLAEREADKIRDEQRKAFVAAREP